MYSINLNCIQTNKPFIIHMSKDDLYELYSLISCANCKSKKISNYWYEADKIHLKQFKIRNTAANYVFINSEVLIELQKVI